MDKRMELYCLTNYSNAPLYDNWTREENFLLEKAYKFATKAHKKQTRKGTKIPYIVHPVEASIIAYELSDKVEVVVAAVLHDIIEDTDYGYSDIENIFGIEIADFVSSESEDKREELPAEQTWKIRKEETLSNLSRESEEVKIIAFADKLSNLRAMARDYEVLGDRLWDKFNQKDKRQQEWYYRTIADITTFLEGNERYREYLNLCNQLFN